MELSDKLKATGVSLLATLMFSAQAYAFQTPERYCSICPPLSGWEKLGEKKTGSRNYTGHQLFGVQLIHEIEDGKVKKFWYICTEDKERAFGYRNNGTDWKYTTDDFKTWKEVGK